MDSDALNVQHVVTVKEQRAKIQWNKQDSCRICKMDIHIFVDGLREEAPYGTTALVLH